jgi:hypothetical protein
MMKSKVLWLLAYAVAALALAFASAGGVLMVLYPETGIDVPLLLWRGWLSSVPSCPFL